MTAIFQKSKSFFLSFSDVYAGVTSKYVTTNSYDDDLPNASVTVLSYDPCDIIFHDTRTHTTLTRISKRPLSSSVIILFYDMIM